ncbi:MAG: MFS transporter [Pseudomonadota bacterium]|nr:MFS transporter [Pseudomonadota bacterium]
MGTMAGEASDVDLAAFIDSQPVGRRQIQMVLMCAAVLLADGFDTQAIGYVAPELAREWQLSRGALGSVFSAGLFGLLLGALLFSPIADRIGRKRIVIGGAIAFGVLTLATTLAHDVATLTVLRFLTGLGLGAALPNAVALTAEISPHRRRATMVMAMFCGFSLGAALGGLIAAAIIPVLGWRSVFVLGGAAPLLLAVYLVWALPESARFLALKDPQDVRVGRIVTWLFPDDAPRPGTRFTVAEEVTHGGPVRALFAEGRTAFTLLLWTVFFMSLLDLYFLSNWLPTVLSDLGASVSTASVIGAMLQVGGLVGTFALGRVIDRFSFQALAVTYLLAAVAIASVGLLHRSIPGVTAAVFASGFCIVGGQIAANALASGSYPTAARATGVGWALGIGRIGSIVGPLLGGLLLSLHWSTEELFGAAAVPALGAAGAALVLSWTAKRDDRHG